MLGHRRALACEKTTNRPGSDTSGIIAQKEQGVERMVLGKCNSVLGSGDHESCGPGVRLGAGWGNDRHRGGR
jgi:hypothetical protein